ncbi:TPA: YadA-like family protein [Escherichia coli]|nr:YadA-like family protein [Escherichia coli]EMF1537988.1 YadA-like family protein [Escherichia coli]HAX5301263.1 adhesin [Escherichia coli]HBA7470412.1 adhesin [Escherichia coli]HBI2791580.1 YadA-like family protein [Escherichia coli]
MNKIFKVIWNPATGSYNVASETAKSRGKKSGRSKLLISALVAGGLLSSFGALADNYEGQPVDYGNGSAGDGWVAIGKNSKANTFVNGSGASTALGYDAIAEGEYSSAIGSRTHAIGGASMAFGVSAQAIGDRSVALGASSVATGGRSMALGRYAKTNGFTSLAIGDTALADGEKTIALGNTAQAYEIMSIALGDHANASKEYSMALGASSVASAANAIAVGRDSAANGTDSLALGRLSLASAANAIAMGAESEAAENATAIGFNADAIGKSSLALGDNASAGETNSIAIGQGSEASKLDSIALGSNSRSAGENAIALGNNSNAGGKNSLAFGFNTTANGDNAVAIGANSSAGADNTVSVGSSSLKRKIVNMGNGDINNVSSDAINGSQLYAISKSVSDRLGGYHDDPDNVINSDGTLKAPTYYLQSGQYNNVGEALQSIDNNTLHWDSKSNKYSASHTVFNANGSVKSTSAKNIITDVADGTISATSSDAVNGSQLYNLKQDALLWDGTAFSAKHGTSNTNSKITNVADGDLSTTSTDAVNGSQLNATNILVTQNSQMINQLAGNTSETYIEENGAGINYVRTNDNGLAFNDASASGIGATAVGYNSVAEGDSSVAIGQGSSSSVDTGIALGSSSVSSRVIVKGSRNTSVTENGVVIGYDTTDGELLGALSIGDDGKYRQIINVADGSEAHDAVTVRQLQNAIGAVATTPTKYFHANSTAEDSLAVGEDSLAMGAKTIVNGNAGIGIGLNTLVLADAINGIAIGSNARANHADSIAMGNGSQTTRGAQTNYTAYNMDAPQNSVGEFSVGSEDGQRQITNVAAGSADTDAVNVGQLKVTDAQVSQNTQSITNLNTQVTNLDTRVTNIENGIGDIVTTGSTKYFKTNTDGADANAQGKDSVAIGSGSIAAADNSVALGTGSVADEENTISVGSSTNQRRITNVAAGVNATDAVNVSQLKSSEAGGVRYDTKADGSIDYSNITLGGGNGGTTRISNVSAGVNNNDAVNYAQLKQSVQETKQYTDQRMVEMDNKLSKTESKLSGGIASAMAMTGLPQAYTPGASMASIGGGTYNGESAVALGVSMVSANGRWVYKLQGSTNSQGEYSAALGAGIQW